MAEDIHNGDEHFKRAYERMEEAPSPEIWEKIGAQLDTIDAAYYRGKSATWKRIAALLLLLLGATVLYYHVTTEREDTTQASNQPKTVRTSPKLAPSENKSSIDKSLASGKATKPASFADTADDSSQVKGEISDHNRYQQSSFAQNSTKNTVAYAFEPNKAKRRRAVTKQHPVILDSRVVLPQYSSSGDSSKFQKAKSPAVSDIANTAIPDNKGKQAVPVVTNGTKDDSQSKQSASVIAKGAKDEKPDLSSLSAGSAAGKKEIAASSVAVKKRNRTSFASSWSVLPFASADLTGYHLDDDMEHGRNQHDHKPEIEGRESHRFSFSAGVLAKWQFLPHWSVKTGLTYSNVAIDIQPQTLYATKGTDQTVDYKFIASSGYAYVKPAPGSSPAIGDSATAQIANHHLQFITVPVMAGYQFQVNRKLSVTPGVGLSANLLLSSRVKTEINEDTDKEIVVINKLQGLHDIHFSFIADAEVNYFINKRISLALLPVFKYAINPLTKDNVVKTFPYSFSMGAGVVYRF